MDVGDDSQHHCHPALLASCTRNGDFDKSLAKVVELKNTLNPNKSNPERVHL